MNSREDVYQEIKSYQDSNPFSGKVVCFEWNKLITNEFLINGKKFAFIDREDHFILERIIPIPKKSFVIIKDSSMKKDKSMYWLMPGCFEKWNLKMRSITNEERDILIQELRNKRAYYGVGEGTSSTSIFD